jgi:predicted amidophosphoribosyltransferase
MDRQGQGDWQYKVQAGQQIAQQFANSWKWADIQNTHHPVLIPMPPAKKRGDPMFDPRMLDVLKWMVTRTQIQLDIRDCLSFTGKYAASQETDDRPTPDELFAELSFDEAASKTNQQPDAIFLFDDMLTTGAHYVAATRMLVQRFPGFQIIGNFVARRIVPNPFEALEDS